MASGGSQKKLFTGWPRLQTALSSIKDDTRELLRKLRLNLITALTRWKNDHEEAKVAIYQNRQTSTLDLLLHIPPFAAVLALIVLNTRSCYIGEVRPTTLTAIQFVAKILELLIQASLAAMVLELIRSQATGSGGLALGRFLAAYRVTDVSYLWSLEFWGSATSNELLSWGGVLTLIAVVATVLTASLVGPASAIAMIPRRIEFQESHILVLSENSSVTFPDDIELVNGGIVYARGSLLRPLLT